MRDFFGRQESARKKSIVLIVLFAVSVSLVVFWIYLAVAFIIALMSFLYKNGFGPFSFMEGVDSSFWVSGRFFVVSIITLLVVLSGTAYKILELSVGGGKRIAEQLGGRLVMRSTLDAEEKQLFNVVEEMSIASGIPVPDVYVMERETGINAFAAGYGIEDAVVCVTRGALFHLNRNELQGMVAHEFSHIFNGDTLINIRLMGWLHGILLFRFIGDIALSEKPEYASSEESFSLWHPFLVIFWLPLYVMGSVGYFFGALIKAVLSRQREHLADASAVQFTRNPLGLARALKKIGGLPSGSELWHPKAAVASHMYFSNGLGKSFFDFMKTHPPLDDRVERLDPYFDGVFPQVKPMTAYNPAYPDPSAPLPPKLADGTVAGAAAMAILESMGTPAEEHVTLTRQMIEELPDELHEATREPWSARALVYSLLLGTDEKFRAVRLLLLENLEEPEVYEETERLASHLDSLSPRSRMPLVDMSMPALKQLSDEQYKAFRERTMQLIRTDRKLSLFEYTLTHVLVHRLDAYFRTGMKKAVQIYSLLGVGWEITVALSIFSRLNKRKDEQAQGAFERGMKVLNKPNMKLKLLPAQECTSSELDKALERLTVASPIIKRTMLAACLECLLYDDAVAVDEAELFRAVAAALDVPAPPWLVGLSSKETKGTEAA